METIPNLKKLNIRREVLRNLSGSQTRLRVNLGPLNSPELEGIHGGSWLTRGCTGGCPTNGHICETASNFLDSVVEIASHAISAAASAVAGSEGSVASGAASGAISYDLASEAVCDLIK